MKKYNNPELKEWRKKHGWKMYNIFVPEECVKELQEYQKKWKQSHPEYWFQHFGKLNSD